jgi:hypothetical protein
MGDQEYNSGKKYRQKGTLCGPNTMEVKRGGDEKFWSPPLVWDSMETPLR